MIYFLLKMKDSVKEIFKELIATFHTSRLPALYKREIDLPSIPLDLRKALVLIGMRRSGKTWCLYQVIEDLIGKGAHLSQMLYLNFEDERLSGMRQENFQDIIKAYYELYPEYLNRADIYFFLMRSMRFLGGKNSFVASSTKKK